MGRAWEPPPDGRPYEPPVPYYDADAGDARDFFGDSMTIGDRVAVIAGGYINRIGTVLDVSLRTAAAAVHIPDFGTRVVPFDCLHRCKR